MTENLFDKRRVKRVFTSESDKENGLRDNVRHYKTKLNFYFSELKKELVQDGVILPNASNPSILATTIKHLQNIRQRRSNNWIEGFSKTHQRPFWENVNTKEKTWDNPFGINPSNDISYLV